MNMNQECWGSKVRLMTQRYWSFEHVGMSSWLFELERHTLNTTERSSYTFPSWLRQGSLEETLRAWKTSEQRTEDLKTIMQQIEILQDKFGATESSSEHSQDVESKALHYEQYLCECVLRTRIAYGDILERAACEEWRCNHAAKDSTHEGDVKDGGKAAWLMYASLCAAIWTSAHVSALDRLCAWCESHSIKADSNRVSKSPSCLKNLIYFEPNMRSPVNAFSENVCNGAFASRVPLGACNRTGNPWHQLLVRAINPASRGWPVSLASIMSKGSIVSPLIYESLLIACTGLHAILAPTVRPSWKERRQIHRVFSTRIPGFFHRITASQKDFSDVVKEAVRRTLATSLMDELPMRAAMCVLQMQGFQLSHPPEAFPHLGLMQSMTRLCRHALQLSHSMPMDTQTLSLALSKVNFSPWMGRVRISTPPPTIIDHTSAIYIKAFQAAYLPWWLHSVRYGARSQRFDQAQYDGIHEMNTAVRLTQTLEVKHSLRIQRAVLQDPLAAFRNLSETVAILQPLLELDTTPISINPKDYISTILQSSPLMCAGLLHYGRMAWLREQITIVNLGEHHKAVNVLSLADCYKLFELPTYAQNVRELDDVLLYIQSLKNGNGLTSQTVQFKAYQRLLNQVEALPVNATHICVCSECRRVANTMRVVRKHVVDDAQKIGIVAAMVTPNEEMDPRYKKMRVYCAKRASAAFKAATSAALQATERAIEQQPIFGTTEPNSLSTTLESHLLVEDDDDDRLSGEHNTDFENAVPGHFDSDNESVLGSDNMAQSESRAYVQDEFEADELEDIDGVLTRTDNEPTTQPFLDETSSANASSKPRSSKRTRNTSRVKEKVDDVLYSSYSRMRRDCKRCFEQKRISLPCGSTPMLTIPILGRAVRIWGEWFSLCTVCGMAMSCDPTFRLSTRIVCRACNMNIAPRASDELESALERVMKLNQSRSCVDRVDVCCE